MAFEIVTWNCHTIVCGRVLDKIFNPGFLFVYARVFFLYMRAFLGQQILEE